MNDQKYDVAVIGAGPAGIFASGIAAENNARVILIEKNEKPGKKLLITGKGRCNITNAEFDKDIFIDSFGKKGNFLFPSLYAFGNEEIIDFFNKKGLDTKIERGKRVFPESDRSRDVFNILLNFLRKNNVAIKTNCPIKKINFKNNHITEVCAGDKIFKADKYILCTGGASYASTGSSGDGYRWLKLLGHKVIKPEPCLVPVRCKETWVKEVKELTLKNVRISLFQENKKKDERFGEASFTSNGMGGPVILDMSKHITKLLKKGEVKLSIDLKPVLDNKKLDARILRDFLQNSSRIYKNSLDRLLPKKLIPVIISLSKIDENKKVNLITKEERKKLVNLFKNLCLTVLSIESFNKAVITAGGIELKEVDPRTMKSKIIDNLYFAGEILDIDGPTGGYNLQVCWSTGFLAGKNAAFGR